jgi:hypothetical protein
MHKYSVVQWWKADRRERSFRKIFYMYRSDNFNCSPSIIWKMSLSFIRKCLYLNLINGIDEIIDFFHTF